MQKSNQQQHSRVRLDLVEVALVGLVLVLTTFILMTWAFAQSESFAREGLVELGPIARAYGPGQHSSYNEEWIIRDFFNDRRDGVFVDVGANHYRDSSNTYFLEIERGWSGIAIDAQGEFADGYQRYRPHTKFFTFFASDASGRPEKLYVPKDPQLASSDRAFAERFGKTVPREVPTITLTDLLVREHIKSFDFLSMDIELGEPKALAGFDIDRFQPSLVCIEAHLEVRQQILEYFARHHYVIVGKYLRAEPKNLYFSLLPS